MLSNIGQPYPRLYLCKWQSYSTLHLTILFNYKKNLTNNKFAFV